MRAGFLQTQGVDEHMSIDALQHLTHQTLRLSHVEVGRANVVGVSEELGAIDSPDVVGHVVRVIEPRAAKPPLPKVLEPSGETKHGVLAAVERRDPVGEIRQPIAPARLPGF